MTFHKILESVREESLGKTICLWTIPSRFPQLNHQAEISGDSFLESLLIKPTCFLNSGSRLKMFISYSQKKLFK